MNRIERATIRAAEQLTNRTGRAVYILVAEDDGVTPGGVNYCSHCSCEKHASNDLRGLFRIIDHANTSLWRRLTQDDSPRKGGQS